MITDLSKFIPLDKSWIIRMGILDLRYGKDTTLQTLARSKVLLSDDLKRLLNASLSFPRKNQDVCVGESATLYRFLLFLSWILGQSRRFVLEGTLKDRKITVDSSIVNLSIEELLKLDSETSQWASAAVLCRNDEMPLHLLPYKLELSFEARNHWVECNELGVHWSMRQDPTIENQANVFIEMSEGYDVTFIPTHSEDYCFARAFGSTTLEAGLRNWPSLVNHESNRIEEMELALIQARKGLTVISKDHRVVQAVAMFSKIRGYNPTYSYPNCVSKSWPQFWDFMREIG